MERSDSHKPPRFSILQFFYNNNGLSFVVDRLFLFNLRKIRLKLSNILVLIIFYIKNYVITRKNIMNIYPQIEGGILILLQYIHEIIYIN